MMTLKTTACLMSSAIALASLTAACVTVNVNFPESTVQKATDDYVKELYKAKERGHGSGVSDVFAFRTWNPSRWISSSSAR